MIAERASKFNHSVHLEISDHLQDVVERMLVHIPVHMMQRVFDLREGPGISDLSAFQMRLAARLQKLCVGHAVIDADESTISVDDQQIMINCDMKYTISKNCNCCEVQEATFTHYSCLLKYRTNRG
jgi:hypothetical protein